MSAAFVFYGDKLTAYLDGELDHHSAKTIRQHIDAEISRRQPKSLVLDFSRVTFMDSSGIGLVMGRFKIMSENGGVVVIQNPPPPIKKVMQIAGIGRLARIVHCHETSEPEKTPEKQPKEGNKIEASEDQNDKPNETPVSGSVTE